MEIRRSILAILVALFLFSCGEDCMNDERCDLEPDSGLCQAAFLKYYFDKEEGKCKSFTWGGCGGVVPFETLGDCVAACNCD